MLEELLLLQRGVLSRAQAIAGGLTRAQVEAHLASGRWRRLFVGVYATFTGPVPRTSLLWAAVLRLGAGAVLSHETAAELVGLVDAVTPAIHVTVPVDQSPVRIPGLLIHRSSRVHRCRHPTRTPPQTRIEETVVDLTQSSRDLDDAIAWLARAVGSRMTTADRIAAALHERPRVRARRTLLAALGDVAAGAQSLAELRYLRDVERAHRLPVSSRQTRRSQAGPSVYDDVRYRRHRTRVEVDGRAAHPGNQRFRDMRRDNAAVVDGDRVLRYGFADIAGAPCRIAVQVAEVLRQGGWTGAPRRCGRDDCAVA